MIFVRSLLLLWFMIAGCTAIVEPENKDQTAGVSAPKQRVLTESEYKKQLVLGHVSFQKQVKPILDSRCVICHACYDAPCQLKLNSIEGIDRGATKQTVYDGSRLKAAAPTRLFIDARNTQQWRKKGFYPVLNEYLSSAEYNLDYSVMAKMIQLKRLNSLPETGKLSSAFKFGLNRELECPDINEFSKYQKKHPQWGMPYSFPGLTLKQEYTVLQWLQEGAETGPLPALSAHSVQEVKRWEQFLNGSSLKQKLVARYIYEHLFLGHIHFQGHSEREFFRLVRSSTAPGQPVRELDSVRPFAAPGVDRFYYRLRPIVATIVDKTHLVYELGPKKMRRYKELFFQPDYQVTELPSYEIKSSANPFKTFREIPRDSRYKFMLDNAEYFVSGFIKGPVCRGQVALNVIRDRFWVAFLNPDLDKELKFTRKFDAFLAKQDLTLPAADGDSISLLKFREFDSLARDFLKKKDEFADQIFAEHGGLKLSAIWWGNGRNRNAALTVFRHDDSATVVKGWQGATPLTAWVVDYPIFERIHYLLVAGFNVYGSVAHQLATRTYMDYLRMGSENNFLRFMPIAQRKIYYDSWYQGVTGRMAVFFNKPFYSSDFEPEIDYQTSHYKTEFFDFLRKRMGAATGPLDLINDCRQSSCARPGIAKPQQKVDDAMRNIAALHGEQLQLLPELSFIRVNDPEQGTDYTYSLMVNKVLENVAIMFLENMRRLPKLDSLTVLPELTGSYPGLFFQVNKNELGDFTEKLINARSKKAIDEFYSTYAVRHTNRQIWPLMDWFNEQHVLQKPIRSGLFDMSRYENL